jgi:hypothetical protein
MKFLNLGGLKINKNKNYLLKFILFYLKNNYLKFININYLKYNKYPIFL